MSILGTLALSQIRRKKVRTIITTSAMMLSSSLLTAVVNFVAGSNAMLVSLLGEDYGVYGGAYTLLLLIPAAILGMLIIAMSVIVISNVFRMSANERVVEFGTLKCVGATKEQIYKTIMYECAFLCGIAIPCGVLLGYLFSYFGIGIVNSYMDELNVLVRAMMMPVTFHIAFVFSPAALFLSVVISVATVIISAAIPARKAMEASALECIKNSGEFSVPQYRHTKTKINGKRNIEYQLARKNVTSNNKKMKSAVTAFSISIVLFVTMSGLKTIAGGISDYISLDYGYTVISDYTSNYDYTINPETGRRECYYTQTIDQTLAGQITEELAAYEGNEIFGSGQDYFTYVTILKEDEITKQMREALADQEEEEQSEYELRVEINIVDEQHYKEVCRLAGVEYGDTILLNDYKYNDRGSEKHIVPLPMSVSSLQLEKADGSSEVIEIDGVLAGKDIPEIYMYPNTNPVRLIVPDAEVRGYTWMASPVDEDGYMEYAKAVLEKYFPQNGLNYGEAGFVSRVFGAQDFSKIMNIAIVLASFFLYSFVFLLGLIGMLNVISTMLFNVRMRAREFAVLQSIGMTSGSLRRMLNLESIFCAGKALATGLPVGIIIVWVMRYCVQMILPIPFQMPWATIIGAIAASFILMWGTVQVSANALKDQNVIETIRM